VLISLVDIVFCTLTAPYAALYFLKIGMRPDIDFSSLVVEIATLDDFIKTFRSGFHYAIAPPFVFGGNNGIDVSDRDVFIRLLR
jgi:hypothetical protein